MKKSACAAAVAFVVSLVLGTALAAPALAHTSLKSSDPKRNARVEKLDEITLEFTESVRLPVVLVRSSGGERYEKGKPSVDGPTVTQDVADSLPPGAYTVAWRVVSADGHPVEGEIPFTVAPPATPATSATASTAPGDTSASSDTSAGSQGAGPSGVAGATSGTAAAPAAGATDGAAQDGTAQDGGRTVIPGWAWVVVFGIAGVGIGMLISLRKKP
jgi:methionine-rich copper-binding protein CopC